MTGSSWTAVPSRAGEYRDRIMNSCLRNFCLTMLRTPLCAAET